MSDSNNNRKTWSQYNLLSIVIGSCPLLICCFFWLGALISYIIIIIIIIITITGTTFYQVIIITINITIAQLVIGHHEVN